MGRRMRKVVIHRPGGYDRLVLENAHLPTPKEGEVLVRISATGVNYADCVIRWGLYESANKLMGYPITPGFEFSGVIEDLGPSASTSPWQVGDQVLGLSFFCAYASHVVVPIKQIFPLPRNMTPTQGGGFPAVFLTAYHGLFQNIVIRPKMKILVHSAAGGVGGALLQLGKLAGCEMVGVVGSTHKVDAAKAMGATAVIDKSKEDLWKRAKAISSSGYDVIFDANGPSTLKESYRHLAPTGKLVAYGFHSFFPNSGGKVSYFKLVKGFFQVPRFNPLHMSAANKSIITFNLSFLFNRQDLLFEGMHQLLAWVSEGRIVPSQVTSYPLDNVGDAHRALESGKTIGKLVLIPAPS